MPKTKTRAQVEASKAKAERFVRDVLEDDERADEIADESVESYAERRRFQIENPGGARRSVRRSVAPSDAGRVAGTGGVRTMAKRLTLRERLAVLEAEKAELEEENEELQERLDNIVGVAVGEDADDEDEFEDDDDADDEDEFEDDDDADDDDAEA